MQIREFMTNDHRACDEQFVVVEEAVSGGNFAAAKEAFEGFSAHTLHHFEQEELYLFEEFSSATGMRGGPVEVMKYEHEQFRTLLTQMRAAIEAQDAAEFFGLSEAAMILLQQHNMKEEQMLYNMIQMHLGERNDEIVMHLQQM